MRHGISKQKLSVSLVAVVAAAGLVMMSGWVPFAGPMSGAAWAEDSGGQATGKGHQGGQGQGGKGAQSGQGTSAGKGQGQGGPSSDSDGKGPRAGGPSSSGGGKPVWSQEGIPEVELGRLNVARSPDHVLQRAYDEALSSVTADYVSFYSLSLDQVIDQLANNFDSATYIDSPLQNLALLKDALDGSSALTDLGATADLKTLEAVFLGVASDKTVPITADSVTAVTTILGTPVTGAAAEALAADAEAVRQAVAEGHG